MTVAQSRTARHARIVEILSRTAVRSQGELLDLLARDGHEVTQATLSRDLVEIGAVKVRQGKSLVYAVPGEGGDRTPRVAADDAEVDARLRRLCEDLLVTATASANLVVLRTPPGAANYLASALDRAGGDDIIGTIAGDDTVLVITTAPTGGQAVADRLLALAAGESPPTPDRPTDNERPDAEAHEERGTDGE